MNSFAADEVEKPVAQTQNTADELLEEEEETERIVVTGSRIRRAEFSEASPVQVISGDISRELGLFDAGSMLQSSNQALGVQYDSSFGGFVLDNGPGAATIGFRNLGAERTLVLINGRRMAPAGVGGAPTAADLNLIPGVMIDRIENLFDGASTVYGSDAVAGVANVILKSDIEGFEFDVSGTKPKGSGGEQITLSGMWGTTFDNGHLVVGAEYLERDAVSRAGNDWAKGCNERIWETNDGRIITRNAPTGPTARGDVDTCATFPLTNRITVNNFYGSLYSTPGFTNTGIPGWSETTVSMNTYNQFSDTAGWIPYDNDGDGEPDYAYVDGNGDGFIDVDLQDPRYAFQQSDKYNDSDYIAKNQRYSLMLSGEHNLQDDNDTTVYYEGLYSARKSPQVYDGAQIFEWVTPRNPYNVCGVNGVNCLGQIGGDFIPTWVRPVINLQGDRDYAEVDVSQYRAVTGITGNLSALEGIGLNNWYYDVYVSQSASSGTDIRQGINEERLKHSLDTSVLNDDGSVTCGDGTDGCVPVNLFSENIYQPSGGRLTPEEEEYLFIERYIKTEVSQFIVNGFIGGDLFTLPWNEESVAMILGAEYRKDKIESDPNAATSEGLLWGYFSDKGADGTRFMREAFTEFELPLVRGQSWAEEITLTASGRISDESFYDTAHTYSLKAVYRPTDWLTFRGTKGTSYRAPNLRERFLNGTSGFNTVFDPCVVPTDARISDPLNPNAADGYDAGLDERSDTTLAACRADGLDPTSLGLGTGDADFTDSYSVEIETGGTEELTPETSVAKTWGFVLEQPFSEDFDLSISATRYDIEVTNSIAEPSAGYSIGQCYSSDGVRSFCSRLGRDENGQISLVDGSFVNVGLLTSKGYDYNLYYSQEFILFDKGLDVSFDLQATQTTESLFDILGSVDDNLGEPDVPEWRGTAHLRMEYDNFVFNWQTQYIGGGREDWLDDDEEDFTSDNIGCRGLRNADGSEVLCREVGFTDDYFTHTASVGYEWDNYYIAFTVRNVLNEAPPRVDPNGSWSSNNVPLGVGYSQPRSFVLSASARF
ncbi:TonB-dependent receptor domain-containing protein [Parashewanella spongiae]|nr:TonB-dependent receptor [Parashewanella spongiae]